MENKQPQKVKYFEMYFDDENAKDDELGVYAISLVDKPAIISHWMAFGEDAVAEFKFVQLDKSRRIITGAVMIPDMPIKRLDENNLPFYVVANSDTVEKTAMRFMKNGLTKAINTKHNSKLVPEGCYIFESFITDKQRGITEPVGYKKCPDKTWFVSMHVDNDELYNDFVKTGVLNGFSAECNYRLVEKESQPESVLQGLERIIGNRNTTI